MQAREVKLLIPLSSAQEGGGELGMSAVLGFPQGPANICLIHSRMEELVPEWGIHSDGQSRSYWLLT